MISGAWSMIKTSKQIRRSALSAIFVASVAVLVSAHSMQRISDNPNTPYTNLVGKIPFSIENKFDQPAWFTILVIDPETSKPIDSDWWRTDIAKGKDQDSFLLQPGESRVITVQLRYKKMQVRVCSIALAAGNETSAPPTSSFGSTTRICFNSKFV